MKTRKMTVAIALAGLFAANIAFALPGFSTEATQQNVDRCVAEVAEYADYNRAGRVIHNIETEDRLVSGHTMRIQTLVLDATGDRVIREYKASCAINDQAEIKRFRIRRKGA